jgi:putative transposase
LRLLTIPSSAAESAVEYDASQAGLVFAVKKGAYDTESLIEFLEAFHRHFAREKITLIWDGLPAHRSKAMMAWLARQRRWLVVDALRAYAPDLNPVELLWGNVKGCGAGQLVPPRPSKKPATPPKPDCCAPVGTTSCASTSWSTPVFLCSLGARMLPKAF